MLLTPRREIIKPPYGGVLAARQLDMVRDNGVMRGVGRGFMNLRGVASSGPTSLSDVVASACIHLESTDSASYSGSGQTWANIIASPADGETASNFDLDLGATSSASTDDPTFNGTAGTTGAYWSFDGGDGFERPSNWTTTNFLRTAHRTTGGTAWTIGVIIKIAASAGTKTIWTTQQNASQTGIRMQSSATEEIQVFQRGGTAAVSANTGYTHGSGYEFLMVGTAAGGGTHNYWFNNRTASTFNLTYNTITTGLQTRYAIGWTIDNNVFVPSGSEIRSFFAFNDMLDNTEAGAVIDYFNALHGVTYA